MFAVYWVLAVIGAMLDTLEIDRPAEAISIYREPQLPVRGTAPISARD